MPTNEPHWADAALEQLANAIAGLQRKARVLIVEDDPMQATFLQECLAIYPCEIVVKTSSKDAIDSIAASKFDVVFLDLRLKGNHGLNVLQNAKVLIEPPPFLVVTAFAREEDATAARNLGAMTILEKPISREFLENLFGAIHRNATRP